MSKYNFELNLNDRNSLSVLLTRIKNNSTVLEFGPANGRMTKYMKEQLNCKVFAVEIDEQSARDATQYTEKIIVDSIENYTWKEEFKNIKFDYIIFADVLEHLYYPEKVLLNVKEFLKEDGSVLVSIPNIAHNSIIINLLKNEFNYNPTGLLDNTHIRFFTKKTFDELIEKTGYFISYETAIFLNPENTEFRNSYDELQPEISQYLRNLPCGEIYQLIYEFGKKQTDKISDFSDNYIVYNKNFIQLFVENENTHFTEENSIKYPVSQTTELQRFEFDLKDFENIKNLRLDPSVDYCVLEIKDCSIILEDASEVNLNQQVQTNAFYFDGEKYFFDTNDPQIFFIDSKQFANISIKEFQIELHFKHIGEDALIECLKIKEYFLNNLQSKVDFKTKELESIYNSKSWKLIKKLSSILKLIKRK